MSRTHPQLSPRGAGGGFPLQHQTRIDAKVETGESAVEAEGAAIKGKGIGKAAGGAGTKGAGKETRIFPTTGLGARDAPVARGGKQQLVGLAGNGTQVLALATQLHIAAIKVESGGCLGIGSGGGEAEADNILALGLKAIH